MTPSDLATIALTLAVLVLVIVRQQRWRVRGTRPVWRVGAILAVVGVALLAQDVSPSLRLTPADLAFGLVSVVVAAASGALMGRITIFRPSAHGVEYRLPAVGLLLWAVVVGLRVADVAAAHAAGAVVASSTAFLLVSLGVNRLVSGLVVEARLPRTPAAALPVR